MKKFACLCLSLLLAVGLCACGEKKTGGVTFDDMPITSIRNAKTGDTLELGMSQGEIEDMIGKGEDLGDARFAYGTNANGLGIEYEGNISISFGLYGDNPWRLRHGIKAGDKISDMFRYYGEIEIKDTKGTDGNPLFSSASYSIDEGGRIVESSLDSKFSIFVSLMDDRETIDCLIVSND